ncbi:MAG: MotA/TolQ/ExbB proton channel family protein [SAR324 cluster bacterium]|nr:MotA/TolQ/ExbB proton channel family protein [SAR324 cluster bacterium]
MADSKNSGGARRTSHERGGYAARLVRWVNQFFTRREIYSRVEEDFPSWEEYSQQKLDEAQAKEQGLIDLPPHRVFISSPLQWNFLFFLLVAASLAIGYAKPEWAPYFVYGAIMLLFLVAMFLIVRDGIFYHLEGHRLEQDCDMINENVDGPDPVKEPDKPRGFLQSLVRRKSSIFRSTLLQIHYQNVLRTFQQGSRRARVNQESSIADIHTLLTQRSMKLVWTFIEVLPQLGLIGTLIGLTRMFLAFSVNAELPELSIITGFGTALGTTILANLFVLILRPLYMRNERAMFEILNSLQILMATFILPTQNYALRGLGPGAEPGFNPMQAGPLSSAGNPARLANTVQELTHTLEGVMNAQKKQLAGGGSSKEALEIAEHMKSTVEALKETEPIQVNFSAQALSKLTEAMQTMTSKLDHMVGKGSEKGGSSKQIEHDLLQLRMLNHDTLLLMDQMANQLERLGAGKSGLLSQNPSTRGQVLSESPPPGDSLAELTGEEARGESRRGRSIRSRASRMLRGRR